MEQKQKMPLKNIQMKFKHIFMEFTIEKEFMVKT